MGGQGGRIKTEVRKYRSAGMSALKGMNSAVPPEKWVGKIRLRSKF